MTNAVEETLQPSTPATLSGGLATRFASKFAVAIAVPVLGLLLWELAASAGWLNARLMPPPSRTFATLWSLAETGELYRHIAATTLRVLIGFAIGAAAATVAGALVGYFATLRRLVDPTLQALRAIPSIAWVPLFILWFGIFETSKVVLIAVGVFFPVYLGVVGAILSVDRKIVEVGRMFRLSGFALVRRILLPAVLPTYIVSLRAGLGLGWMFVVAAEFMGLRKGWAICSSTDSSSASPIRFSPPSSSSQSPAS